MQKRNETQILGWAVVLCAEILRTTNSVMGDHTFHNRRPEKQ